MATKYAATRMLSKSNMPFDMGQAFDHAKRVMGNPLESAVANELRKIVVANQRAMQRYGFAGRQGMCRRAAKLEYMLTQSLGFRILGVIFGYPKKSSTITWDEVKGIAKRANPRIANDETVKVVEKQKAGGGVRPIAIFGNVTRSSQCMAKFLVHARIGHSPYEYSRKGRGRETLISGINNSVRNGGVRALGTLDVKDCFGHIGVEAVVSVVPISEAIIRNSIFIPKHTHINNKTTQISPNAVPARLPQGALSSVIVAGLVLKPCIDAVQARFAGSYIDDITFGDASQSKVQEHINTLIDNLKGQYPSSPLFAKCSEAFNIGERADILGYWARPNPNEFGGGARFSPSEKAIRRFYVRVTAELLQIPYGEWAGWIEEKAYNWAASFKHWRGSLGGREMVQTVFYMNIEPLLVDAHDHVLSAKFKAGKDVEALQELARNYAMSLIPKCVLVNENGFCDF